MSPVDAVDGSSSRLLNVRPGFIGEVALVPGSLVFLFVRDLLRYLRI
jgi:hypothetical protein